MKRLDNSYVKLARKADGWSDRRVVIVCSLLFVLAHGLLGVLFWLIINGGIAMFEAMGGKG